MHPVLVREDQPERAVGVDDVDPANGDLVELLRDGLPERSRSENDEHQGPCGGVRAEEPQFTAKRLTQVVLLVAT